MEAIKHASPEQEETPEERALRIKAQRWGIASKVFFGIALVSMVALLLVSLSLAQIIAVPLLASVSLKLGAAGVGIAASGFSIFTGAKASLAYSKYSKLKIENAFKKIHEAAKGVEKELDDLKRKAA